MTGETILVVDDTAENREFVVEYVLQPNGYQPLTAKDGKEGLDLAIAYRPDLIILDYNMPIMDGPGMLRAMNSHGLDIPVILMTFHGSEDIAVEVFRLGARDYIIKPFYPEEMENAIDRHLSEVRLRREKDALTNRVIQANRDLKSRLQELNMLYHIGKHVTALLNIQQLLLRVVEAAVQITRSERGYMYINQNRALICRASKGSPDRTAQVENRITNDPIPLQALQSSKQIVLDADQTRKMRADSAAIVAYTPLIVGGKTIGVLGVERDTDLYTSHDSALISALSDYVAIAITNSRNYEARKRLKEQMRQSGSTTLFEDEAEPQISEEEIALIYAEMSGITDLVEAEQSPDTIMDIINTVTDLSREIILTFSGTMSTRTDSAFYAIFSPQTGNHDHLRRAAQAAYALQQVSKQGELPNNLQFQIGVSMGKAIINRNDQETASAITTIGNVTHLGRLLAEYAEPGQILLDDNAMTYLGGDAQIRALGEIRTRNNRQPVSVFELLQLG
ncbi:MAG: response regulator [Chloroflexota bacterium]